MSSKIVYKINGLLNKYSNLSKEINSLLDEYSDLADIKLKLIVKNSPDSIFTFLDLVNPHHTLYFLYLFKDEFKKTNCEFLYDLYNQIIYSDVVEKKGKGKNVKRLFRKRN